MTPYQLGLHVIDYNERKEEEQKRREIEAEENLQLTYLAALWTSRFVWQKHVKSYEELTKKQTDKKQMTAEQMLEEVKKLNMSLGGTTY